MLNTTAQKYYTNLYQVQEEFSHTIANLLPGKDNVYNIDLNTRLISKINDLGVIHDHNAKVIYFKLARFFDNQDLSQTSCIIQYTNANLKDGMYIVPFYDIDAYKDTQEMLIPWMISGEVTEGAGNVSFSLRFFDVDDDRTLLYNISTQAQTSKVLPGVILNDEFKEKYKINATILDNITERLSDYARQLNLTWLDLSVDSHDLVFSSVEPEYVLSEGHRDYLTIYYQLKDGVYEPVKFTNTNPYKAGEYYYLSNKAIKADISVNEFGSCTIVNSLGYKMNIMMYKDDKLMDTYEGIRSGAEIIIPNLGINKITVLISTELSPNQCKGTYYINY